MDSNQVSLVLMKRINRKLLIVLKGGLGNQLFQYFSALGMARRTNRQLIIDDKTGFFLDLKYQRKLLLGELGFPYVTASLIQRLPFMLLYLIKLIPVKVYRLIPPNAFIDIIQDKETSYDDRPFNSHSILLYIEGYWQSENYFNTPHLSSRIQLYHDLKYYYPADFKHEITSNDVALCIRYYEESGVPGHHCRDGKVKSAEQISKAVKMCSLGLETPRVFFFSTIRPPDISRIELLGDPVFVIGSDSGYTNLQTLALMAEFHNFVITNSSFYWWGAYLAGANKKTSVWCADNFVNADTPLAEWNLF